MKIKEKLSCVYRSTMDQNKCSDKKKLKINLVPFKKLRQTDDGPTNRWT